MIVLSYHYVISLIICDYTVRDLTSLVKIFPSLRIGDLQVNPPIIQGGMGVRVSLSRLAAAAANEGCVGVIASAGIGNFTDDSIVDINEVNEKALRQEIRKARQMTNGILGVNIMVALSDYESLARAAVEEEVDLIVSGAGLPLHLPEYARGSRVKLIPIVSSARAFKIICSKWQKNYGRRPDAVIVEGPLAGGHLGYSYEEMTAGTAMRLEESMAEILPLARSFSPAIPVIAAGGIFDGADIAHYLGLGASGVQMATRFVCTQECDADDTFKQAYLAAKEADVTIINSPVGLPGQVIRNGFVDRIQAGKCLPYRCKYQCLRSCNSKEAPYCIADVLDRAAQGKLTDAFVFAGSNVYRCNEIVTVKTLIQKVTQEYILFGQNNFAPFPEDLESKKVRSEP